MPPTKARTLATTTLAQLRIERGFTFTDARRQYHAQHYIAKDARRSARRLTYGPQPSNIQSLTHSNHYFVSPCGPVVADLKVLPNISHEDYLSSRNALLEHLRYTEWSPKVRKLVVRDFDRFRKPSAQQANTASEEA